MTPTSRKSDEAGVKRLESLYQRAADVEPDARLDRAVLDRARRTAPRSDRLGSWAYGLAGALCLVLVIGVGLRQELRISEVPVEVHEDRTSERELSESPSAFAPRGGAPVTEAEPGGEPPVQAARRTAAELSHRESGQLAADAASFVEDQAAAPDALFARIRALLAAGHEAQARQALDSFRESHPEADIPADLEEELGSAARARAGEEP